MIDGICDEAHVVARTARNSVSANERDSGNIPVVSGATVCTRLRDTPVRKRHGETLRVGCCAQTCVLIEGRTASGTGMQPDHQRDALAGLERAGHQQIKLLFLVARDHRDVIQPWTHVGVAS